MHKIALLLILIGILLLSVCIAHQLTDQGLVGPGPPVSGFNLLNRISIVNVVFSDGHLLIRERDCGYRTYVSRTHGAGSYVTRLERNRWVA